MVKLSCHYRICIEIYGTLDIVLGATLMYRKGLKMSYTKITAPPTSFACISG